MSAHSRPPMGVIERALVALDETPWCVAYRVAMGYFLVPSLEFFIGAHRGGWLVVAWFVFLLIALRVVPAVARKVLPFSKEAASVWLSRRMMAKRYDSYQWRKLFWIGIGLSAFVLLHGEADRAVTGLAIFSLVGGLAGMAAFRTRMRATADRQYNAR